MQKSRLNCRHSTLLFNQVVSEPDYNLKRLYLIKLSFLIKQTHLSRHARDTSYLLEMEGTQVPLDLAWFANTDISLSGQ